MSTFNSAYMPSIFLKYKLLKYQHSNYIMARRESIEITVCKLQS